MYSTTENKGTFFQNEKAKEISTSKCIFGNFSQRVKEPKSEDGYVYENWSLRLVGSACSKAAEINLKDNTFISLKKWNAHCIYDKEKGSRPYLLVSDFDIVEKVDSEAIVFE